MAKINKLQATYAHKAKNISSIVDMMADALLAQCAHSLVPKKKGKLEGSGRYIPKNVKFQAMNRANNKCENCGSAHTLQFEHIIPFAKGGTSSIDNIMILCRNCNIRSGIREFGTKKMKRRSQ